MKNKWTKVLQIDEAIAFLKEKLSVAGASYVIEQEAFETASGVGINITDADVTKLVEEAFKFHEKDLDAQKWDFQTSKLLYWCRETQKWADSKLVTQMVNEKMVKLFGEKPENDGKRKKAGKLATDEKKSLKVNAVKDPEAEATTGKSIIDLIGRDCNIGANSEEHLKKHREFTGGRIITRFPPEPNGYLHIGHAKAMRFNFTIAKENGGECYLRFDDTNPVKENHDFIDHIEKNVAWLGYKPWKVTTASGNFDKLYEYAIELIKKDKAYVCHQPSDEMKLFRNEKRDSPYRNRTVEENLELFEMMR